MFPPVSMAVNPHCSRGFGTPVIHVSNKQLITCQWYMCLLWI